MAVLGMEVILGDPFSLLPVDCIARRAQARACPSSDSESSSRPWTATALAMLLGPPSSHSLQIYPYFRTFGIDIRIV